MERHTVGIQTENHHSPSPECSEDRCLGHLLSLGLLEYKMRGLAMLTSDVFDLTFYRM